MPDVTFEWNKAKITVREEIGRDEWRIQYVRGDVQRAYALAKGKKQDALTQWERIDCNEFALILLRSSVKGSLGYPWPDYEASTAEQLYAAFEQWTKSPCELIKTWYKAINDSDFKTPDPEGLPDAETSSTA